MHLQYRRNMVKDTCLQKPAVQSLQKLGPRDSRTDLLLGVALGSGWSGRGSTAASGGARRGGSYDGGEASQRAGAGSSRSGAARSRPVVEVVELGNGGDGANR
uniref:Uncharacterized protein n=1 Tax=Arundo donax TaxID=35708 RepID=A0A0A9D5K9_ARUDO